MRINHNIAALNTYNKFSAANAAQGKSMEKLSSGLRINKAGDDAAGLAISEKMRGQIRGLDQASRNAQDGISMAQTAEGALNETHDILQRMRELAVQASNDTNTSNDRGEIQKEVNQLTSEINRIGNTTEFNTQKLINGDKKVTTTPGTAHVTGTGTLTSGADAGSITPSTGTVTFTGAGTDTKKVSINGFDFNFASSPADTDASDASYDVALGTDAATAASALKSAFDAAKTGGATELANLSMSVNNGTVTISDSTGSNTTALTTDDPSAAASGATLAGGAPAPGAQAATGTVTIGAVTEGEKVTFGNKSVGFYDSSKGTYADATAAKTALGTDAVVDVYDSVGGAAKTASTIATDVKTAHAGLSGQDVSLSGSGAAITVTAATPGVAGNSIATVATGVTTTTGGVNLQIGANQSQSLTLDISDMRASALGITGTQNTQGFTASNSVTDGTSNTTTEAALDVSNATNASAAITKIQTAIDKVSAERSKIGAYTNRLEHTINNLGTSSENLTAAESRVRDVDMAKEMMNQTKNSILSQAAQAMLAQSNQMPQGVLQLLK